MLLDCVHVSKHLQEDGLSNIAYANSKRKLPCYLDLAMIKQWTRLAHGIGTHKVGDAHALVAHQHRHAQP